MSINLELLKNSLPVFEANREGVRRRFYEILLSENPHLSDYFNEAEKDSLSELLDKSLQTMLRYFDNPDKLEKDLEEIGSEYWRDWMRPEHWALYRDTFMAALEDEIGAGLSRAAYDVWDEVLGISLIIVQRVCRKATEAHG